MKIVYSAIPSLAEAEFKARAIPNELLKDPSNYTLADDAEMAKIERLLDAKEGLLNRNDSYLEKYDCPCGRTLTTYDFTFTALVDAGHDKSLVLHTLIGNKRIINKARITRCTACSRLSVKPLTYSMEVSGYSCSVS